MASNENHGPIKWNGGRRDLATCQAWLTAIENAIDAQSGSAEDIRSDLAQELESAKAALERALDP
ncbi:MAG: hypothetical protein AAFW60_04590 [Pseudomonadota bacterium]